MKQKILILSGCGVRSLFCGAIALLFGWGGGSASHAATLIDLARPVSESLPVISGVYWSGNSIASSPPYEITPDGSANGYHGFLLTGDGSYSQTTGVDRAGTSGYGNGIRLETTATAPGGSGNPKIQVNLPSGNALDMVATDFSGGLWVNFQSLLAGAQTVNLMNRGPWFVAGTGHWGLNLIKDASGNWQMAFQVADGTSLATVQVEVPVSLTIATGIWHHFGFSYAYGEGGGSNVVTFWMDGVNLGSQSLSVNIAADGGSTRRFAVGERTTTGYTSVFDGVVDDVFVTQGWYGFKAIPEPETYVLLFLGTGAFLLMRQKRTNRN